jgi:tRNA A37 threonylcarbamoyladenosine modification protein TsaB|tara:strand:+ start:115 stop:498 length:384 start_codon:yes stop_codon:yes gene_type:complete
MIKDFLIINCTGINDSIGLKFDNNFFIKEFQINTRSNDLIVSYILDFLKKNNAKIDKNFSIIVNVGPGRFSSIRTSIAVAKGIQIAKGTQLYGYNNSVLTEFNLKNIEFLISNNLIANKLIKPVYIS